MLMLCDAWKVYATCLGRELQPNCLYIISVHEPVRWRWRLRFRRRRRWRLCGRWRSRRALRTRQLFIQRLDGFDLGIDTVLAAQVCDTRWRWQPIALRRVRRARAYWAWRGLYWPRHFHRRLGQHWPAGRDDDDLQYKLHCSETASVASVYKGRSMEGN